MRVRVRVLWGGLSFLPNHPSPTGARAVEGVLQHVTDKCINHDGGQDVAQMLTGLRQLTLPRGSIAVESVPDLVGPLGSTWDGLHRELKEIFKNGVYSRHLEADASPDTCGPFVKVTEHDPTCTVRSNSPGTRRWRRSAYRFHSLDG